MKGSLCLVLGVSMILMNKSKHGIPRKVHSTFEEGKFSWYACHQLSRCVPLLALDVHDAHWNS